jgi:hypothetical protein
VCFLSVVVEPCERVSGCWVAVVGMRIASWGSILNCGGFVSGFHGQLSCADRLVCAMRGFRVVLEFVGVLGVTETAL